MDPLHSERRVIEAAEELARSLGSSDIHTVAAVAMDVTGTIHPTPWLPCPVKDGRATDPFPSRQPRSVRPDPFRSR